jgi:hypothetical protein
VSPTNVMRRGGGHGSDRWPVNILGPGGDPQLTNIMVLFFLPLSILAVSPDGEPPK